MGEEGVYLSDEFPISYLYFDEEERKFKLFVDNGEGDYMTVDLSKRDAKYASEAIGYVALIVEDI